MTTESACLKFFNNPRINPITNKPIDNREYHYYVNECKKIGYVITRYKSYRWQKVGELSPIFTNEDLLFNILLNTSIDCIQALSLTNKLASYIFHSKQFLRHLLDKNFRLNGRYNNIYYGIGSYRIEVKNSSIYRFYRVYTYNLW
jgi:hypothetical protein